MSWWDCASMGDPNSAYGCAYGGALLKRTVEKRVYTSIISISKCWHFMRAFTRTVHKLSRFPDNCHFLLQAMN